MGAFLIPVVAWIVLSLGLGFFWPVLSWALMVGSTLLAWGVCSWMVFGVRPPAIPDESPKVRVRRLYAYALHTFPVTGQLLSHALTILGFSTWALVPLELWKGHWGLAALALLPNFLMFRTVILLFPYAHADGKDPVLREEVALLIELKNDLAAERSAAELR